MFFAHIKRMTDKIAKSIHLLRIIDVCPIQDYRQLFTLYILDALVTENAIITPHICHDHANKERNICLIAEMAKLLF